MAASALGFSNEDRSPGSLPVYMERTTRRRIFQLRVRGRPQTLARDLDGVVAPTKHVPQTILGVDISPVAVHPCIGQPRPVRVEVALAIAPESARHAGPRVADHQLADLAAHRLAFRVDDVRGNSWQRARERRRAQMRDDVAAQDPARDLGAAGVVDDREATAADVLEEPVEGLGAPLVARAAEEAQARAAVATRPL